MNEKRHRKEESFEYICHLRSSRTKNVHTFLNGENGMEHEQQLHNGNENLLSDWAANTRKIKAAPINGAVRCSQRNRNRPARYCEEDSPTGHFLQSPTPLLETSEAKYNGLENGDNTSDNQDVGGGGKISNSRSPPLSTLRRFSRRKLSVTNYAEDDPEVLSTYDRPDLKYSSSLLSTTDSFASPTIQTRGRLRQRSDRFQCRSNLPLEDEQLEFNRQYSLDLCSRRRKATTSCSPNKNTNFVETETASTESHIKNNSQLSKETSSSSVSTRKKKHITPMGENIEENDRKMLSSIGVRWSYRLRHITDQSSNKFCSQQNEIDDVKAQHASYESDEQATTNVRSLRPRRSKVSPPEASRCPPSPQTESMRQLPTRSCRREIMSMDQYSTDDEFVSDLHKDDRSPSTKGRKYELRKNRRTTSHYTTMPTRLDDCRLRHKSSGRRNKEFRSSKIRRRTFASRDLPPNADRDGSSSSRSSDDSNSESNSSDENRFERRKHKRMVLERTKMIPVNMTPQDVSSSIFKERKKVGASLADVSPMEMDLNVTFESVGGCQDHINSIKEMVMFPLLYPEVFSKFSIHPPRGVLFYGPPGTGKTLIARALACECSKKGRRVAFFMRKGADCLSKWIGESERQLRLLFDQAYLMRPSIIFFDEIDGLAPVRSSRQDQIHSSIVSTLLALMDGLDSRGEIIVIGATNRIENIDPALRRPGRFDRELQFSIPTRSARLDILTLLSSSWPQRLSSETLGLLADKTIGFCGADLKGLCAEAALICLRRRYPQVYKSNKRLALDLDQIVVTEEDMLRAITHMVPSTFRVQGQLQIPLSKTIQPLLSDTLMRICQRLEKILPSTESSCYRPRLLLAGSSGQGQTTHLGPAILHHFERLPYQLLDIISLFSNSARSPEEALSQIMCEVRRSLPAVLYMPHIEKLWRSACETVREALICALSDLPYNCPLLILATSEEPYLSLPTPIQHMFMAAFDEVVALKEPNSEERESFFKPIFEKAVSIKHVAEDDDDKQAQEEELLSDDVDTSIEVRRLTEREEKRLRKKEECRLRELRIFLRDIWGKINREQKFFMFRAPVDTTEVYDYLDIVKEPMDFDKMLSRLDDHMYNCAQDFLDDIDLICENAINYNSDHSYETNKIICHRARSLQDYCYALVKAEMDTDFEEECRGIVNRRKILSQKLLEMQHKEANNTSAVSDTLTVRRGRQSTERKKCIPPRRGKDSKSLTVMNTEAECMNMPSSSSVIQIDLEALQNVKTDLLHLTEGYNVERCERTLSRLMSIINNSYIFKSNRLNLSNDLKAELVLLKSIRL